MKPRFHPGVVYVFWASLYVMSGCADENEKTVFTIPHTVTLKQTIWKRQPYISEKEEQLLELTIERNPGIADFEELPLSADALDVVLLHHVLEYTSNPHQLLREATRVLIPRGHLIIVGFNRFSLWGGWKFFARKVRQSTHWQYNSLRLGRLLDWLELLDFEVTSISHGLYRPPLRGQAMMEKLSFLETVGNRLGWPLGAVYVVVARKDVIPVTPIKNRWSWRPQTIVPLPIIHREQPLSEKSH